MGLMQHLRGRAAARRTSDDRPSHGRRRAGASVEAVEPRLLLAASPIAKAHPLGKIGGALGDLYADFTAFRREHPGKPDSAFSPQDKLIRTRGDLVPVEVIATGDVGDLVKALKTIGMRGAKAAGSLVGGLLPIDALDDLARQAGVQSARPSVYTTHADADAGEPSATHAGVTTSQADAAMRADVARSKYGVNGAGSVVGVISDSYDARPGWGIDAADDVASGDLPPGVSVLREGDTYDPTIPNDRFGTDEGRAMAQLVHDVAPGAGLAFHTAGLNQVEFADGITALRTTGGADVIVDDVIFLHEPMFQDGVIARSVDAAVAAGVPYFSAAGNMARQSYDSAFRAGQTFGGGAFAVDRSASSQLPPEFAFYGGVAHDFNPATTNVDVFQAFTLGPRQRIQLSVQWDSPYRSAGPVGTPNDMDVYVLNANGDTVVGGAANDNVGGDPAEVFSFTNTTGATASFNLMLTTYAGANPGRVKYVNFGTNNFNEYLTNSPTVYGHANAAGAAAVAAAFYEDTPAYGANPPVVEGFSSRGGTPILFGPGGDRLPSPVTRDKPRITAPDGTNTTFFGSDISEDADGYPNFFGTSAAAPHAAAVAALMQDAAGFVAPSVIYKAMEDTALDMDNPDTGVFDTGRDDATGFGLIRADLAIGALPTAAPGTPDLMTGSDHGTSNYDNVTQLDNGGPGRGLQFEVAGTLAGATVTVYAGATAIGSAVAGGTTTTVATNESFDLADGAHAITARQAEPGKATSAASAALTVTVDTVRPTVDIVDVTPDPRSSAVDLVDIMFSEPVSGLSGDTLLLTRDGTAIDWRNSSVALTRSSSRSFQFGSLLPWTKEAGDYALTFDPDRADPNYLFASDVAGNETAVGASDAWRVTAAAPAPQSVTLRAAADTYARDGSSAGTNFGAATELVVKKSSTAGSSRESFLRFDLSGVGSVAAAKLRLFGRLGNTDNASVTTTVYNSANLTWPESTTNWNNRPAAGTTARGTITVSGTTAKWYELDLTSFLKAEKEAGRNLVTLVLRNATSSSATINFASDETTTTANRPQLVVTPGDAPAAAQALIVSPANLRVGEGGGVNSFTVELAARPSSNVTVTASKVSGGDPDLRLGSTPTTLTFTPDNWFARQYVDVVADEDADTTNGTASFTVSSSGLASKTVVATEYDNDDPPAGATPVTLRAGADAYVRDGSTYAGTNFGAATQLQVKQGNVGWNREAYLRFDLSPASAVNSATLRLFGKLDNTSASSAGFTVFNSANTSWSETAINYNTKLAAGTTVRGTGTVTGTAGTWYEVDLTAFLAAEKAAGKNLVTLVIRATAASASTIVFDSDEGPNRPELLVS